MVIKTNFGHFRVLKNTKNALNIEKFEEAYIEEWYNQFDYIVGDISDEKLRLKGFSKNPNDKNFFHYIPDYLLESCTYLPSYFILKKISEDEYESCKNEPLDSTITDSDQRTFSLVKQPYDKDSITLEKSNKRKPNIKIDPIKMNEVKTYPLPDDLSKEILKDKQFEARQNHNARNFKNNRNKK